MSKLLTDLSSSTSTKLPSSRNTALIFTCFLLISSVFYVLSFSSTASSLTSKLFNFSKKNTTTSCDMFDGTWVFDDSYPAYAPGSCPFVEEYADCPGNGRPDLRYLKYRWQPHGCDLPRFDAKRMMEMLRGKRLVFIGDSLNRNMCQSMACLLKMFNAQSLISRGLEDDYPYKSSYYYKDYNCSINYVEAPYLVELRRREILKLDGVEPYTHKYHDADFLIFNTGHWWNHNISIQGENFYQEGDVVHSKMDVVTAYRTALNTWAEWVDNYVNRTKTRVFFVGFSVTHFLGDWEFGGTCDDATEPLSEEKSTTPYPWMMQELETVISRMKTPVVYLNVTKMTDFRKDAHPSVYRHHLGSKPQRPEENSQDCSHWCLPGVPDSWNDLLFSSMLLSSSS